MTPCPSPAPCRRSLPSPLFPTRGHGARLRCLWLGAAPQSPQGAPGLPRVLRGEGPPPGAWGWAHPNPNPNPNPTLAGLTFILCIWWGSSQMPLKGALALAQALALALALALAVLPPLLLSCSTARGSVSLSVSQCLSVSLSGPSDATFSYIPYP